MTEIYLLQNQDKLFLNKQGEWVDGREAGGLYKTRHRDEALNQLFEVNTKDYSQRIHVLSCTAKPNGLPQIDPAHLPPPMEKSPTAGPAGSSAGADRAESSRADHQPELAISKN